MVCKVSQYYWHFGQILAVAPVCWFSVLSSTLASTHQEPIAGESHYTQNIQINSYWWKWKMCLLFYGENHTDFLPNPILLKGRVITKVKFLKFFTFNFVLFLKGYFGRIKNCSLCTLGAQTPTNKLALVYEGIAGSVYLRLFFTLSLSLFFFFFWLACLMNQGNTQHLIYLKWLKWLHNRNSTISPWWMQILINAICERLDNFC